MEQVQESTIYYDIETAGDEFDSPITEIAAIAVESGTYIELDSIDMLIQFDMKDPTVKQHILGISKFSPSRWDKYAIPPEDAAIKFAGFLKRHATREKEKKKKPGEFYMVAKLSGHNAQTFDTPLILNWFSKYGPRQSPGRDPFFPALRLTLDTMQKADWFFDDNPAIPRPKNLKLPTLAEYFGLSTPDHSALNDVRATVELSRMIAEYQRVGVMPEAA